jgi:hypothetical protein
MEMRPCPGRHTCDRCTFWEDGIFPGHGHKDCTCPKFWSKTSMATTTLLYLTDGLTYWSADDDFAGFSTGPKFGCVHWRERP